MTEKAKNGLALRDVLSADLSGRGRGKLVRAQRSMVPRRRSSGRIPSFRTRRIPYYQYVYDAWTKGKFFVFRIGKDGFAKFGEYGDIMDALDEMPVDSILAMKGRGAITHGGYAMEMKEWIEGKIREAMANPPPGGYVEIADLSSMDLYGGFGLSGNALELASKAMGGGEICEGYDSVVSDASQVSHDDPGESGLSVTLKDRSGTTVTISIPGDKIAWILKMIADAMA